MVPSSDAEQPPMDDPLSATALVAHLQYGLGDQVRPRLDDQLVVELRRVAIDAAATASDAIDAVSRAAQTTSAGRPLVMAMDDSEATRWLAVMHSDLDAVIAVTRAGTDRELPLFDTIYRRLGDLATDQEVGQDSQRVWMRYHAALGRMAPQGG